MAAMAMEALVAVAWAAAARVAGEWEAEATVVALSGVEGWALVAVAMVGKGAGYLEAEVKVKVPQVEAGKPVMEARRVGAVESVADVLV